MLNSCVNACDVRSRSWIAGPAWGMMVGAMVAVAGAFPGRCRAEGEELSGRVVDRAGVAAADLSIWVIGGGHEHPRVVSKATTDAGGRFRLSPPPGLTGPGDASYLTILAVARDGRLGWRFTVWPRYPQPGEFRIVLGPLGEARGRVSDQDGRPIAGAQVIAVSAIGFGPHHPGRDGLPMPPEIAGPLRATTAADGSFAIKGVPEGVILEARLAATGFADLRISWETARPATIVLDRRVGRVEGTLRPPAAAGVPGPPKLLLRSPRPSDGLAPGALRVIIFQAVTVEKDGTFRVGGLPPGSYDLEADADRGTPSRSGPVARFEVAPNGVARVEAGPNAVARVDAPLHQPIRITGRVVDARTGRGIKGVGVRAGLIDRRNSLQFVDRAETDADGRYTIGARPGAIQMQLNPVPTAYLAPPDSRNPRLDVQGDRTWPELKLDPATALDGVVVDGAGKPVAGARVFALPAGPLPFRMGERAATTGPAGTFHFDQLDPDDTLPLWARTNEATTDGVVVIRPGEVKGKVTLSVDPRFAVRIRGRVTDRSGRRIAGARAVLWWQRDYVSGKLERPGMGIGSALASQATDESGWFVFRGLWPGDRYRVTVEADDYGKVEAPEVRGKAGENHDLGTIALSLAAGHIAGRVVDSDGNPVAGATVFNRGDATMPLEARTDAAGRFRLDSMLPGVKYAFVRKDGHRFTGARVDGDADDLTITLLRTSEPPPAWKPGAGPSLEDQHAFARRVLVRIWEKFGEDAERNGASACIPAMARIDLDLALEWSARRGHLHDARARQAAAEELAETDGPGALELLALVDGRDRPLTLEKLAERFAEADPAKALAFAEEAAVQGRSLPQPNRTWALARAGRVLVRLGRAEAGRKLIDEAAGDAARLGTAAHDGYARGVAAAALAPFELDRALGLIASTDGKDRYTAFIADAIAATQPDRAAALVDAASSPYLSAEVIRTEIAVHLGPVDPDRAVRFIEGMKSSAAEKYGAEGFAWLAAAIAPRDRARAVALIDRALSLPVDRPEAFRSWINFGGGLAVAAHIAASARHAGHPDMDSVIMRVMAARSGPGRIGFSDPAMELQAAATAAVPLALVDPGAARVLLGQLEARSGLDAARLAEMGGVDWLRAWSLVDLDRAGAYVDARLSALEKTRGANLGTTWVFRMIDTLVIPPARREIAVFQADGPSWRPAFEH